MKRETRKGKSSQILTVFLMALMLSASVLCLPFGTARTAQAAETIGLNKTVSRMVAGTKTTLVLNGAEGTVKWTSSNTAVASVSKTGVVTAKKAGTVTITAQYEGKKYTCKIFAEEPQLVTEKTTMIKGQKQTLTVSGTKLKVRWSSSNPSVASVSAQGVLTAKRVGDTVVSATVGGKKFSETVTVEVPALSDTSLTIVKNQKKKITLNGTAQKVTWSVGNEAIASVSASGVITGKKVGNTNVFAVVDGVRYICKLRVDGPYLSRKSLTMTQGTTQQLYVRATSLPVRWLTNKTSVATVSTSGEVTAKSAGTAVITAVVNGQKYTCNVTVTKPAATTGVAGNYEKLLKVIRAKGGVDSKGFLALMESGTLDDGSTYFTEIAYNQSNKKFVYKTRVQIKSEGSTLQVETRMVFSDNAYKKATAQVDVTLPDYGDQGFGLRTSFATGSYTARSNQKFYVAMRTDPNITDEFTNAELQKIGNTYLQFSFETWAYLLKANNTNLTLRNLGFTSYR